MTNVPLGRSAPSHHWWLIALALLVGLCPTDALRAMDHDDGSLLAAAGSPDLCSFYAWPDAAADTLTVVLTFDCRRAPGDVPRYRGDVLYTVHIDNTADPVEAEDYSDNENDNESDIDISVRFGQNALGEWGVQFEGVPGASEPIFAGPVQTVLDGGNGTLAMAGLFDDPFFMDREGLLETLTNLQDSTTSEDLVLEPSDAPPDSFAGTNAMAIVLELPLSTALAGNPDSFLQLWATSGVPGAMAN